MAGAPAGYTYVLSGGLFSAHLTCIRCGCLVAENFTGVHDEWHEEIRSANP
jgi:hypothetical protein